MKIIVDESIPYGAEAFGLLGDVSLMPGRAITPDTLRDADALIIRTITKVDDALLEGTSVQFVGTCTIGEDHVDLDAMARRGVAFSSAPGCNSNSVAEYMTSALLTLHERGVLTLEGQTLGVVGYGNVGTKVAAKARMLGMNVVLCDPPLAEAQGGGVFQPMSDILDCDVITLHVPLTHEGPHATHHLMSAENLACLKPGCVLFNSSRGPVIDNAALLAALEAGQLATAVLDVWEFEPRLNPALVDRCALATQHIAGYSLDGKLNATQQIYEAACRHFGLTPDWRAEQVDEHPPIDSITVGGGYWDALRAAVRLNYDIRDDDQLVRDSMGLPAEERGPAFDNLRKKYRRRFEFRHTTVTVEPADARTEKTLAELGFRVYHA
ncbi:MAG: DUF3410 domain-containing protein [Candidatus Hydrogenedens sp.]|nr:DUF3410 domain-containing protein [Candidatus Hydrogenedens sp.]